MTPRRYKSAVTIEPGPGAQPFPQELSQKLAEAVSARRGPPRTQHLRDDGSPRWTNRLALETSPYLLQHAHNPVDCRPSATEPFPPPPPPAPPIFLPFRSSPLP